jgi:chromosomal replication initiation ATPase DnaA
VKEVYETMAKILSSPIAKAVGMVIVLICTILFTSFTTQKTAGEQVAQFAQYQFKNAVREVIAEEVMPKLIENAEAIERLDCMVDQQMQSIYDETIRQIEKTYEKYQKGERDFTKVNFDAIAKTWKALPDERKSDTLKSKYEILMEYYPKLK